MVEHLSKITTPVFLLKQNKIISQGTGFFFISQKPSGTIIFLVTNYHVLTGYPPDDPSPPKGDNVIFYLHKSADNLGDVKEIRLPLFTKNGTPIWISSKEFPAADVAIIPIISFLCKDTQVFGISEDWTKSNMRIRPTSTICLIGYPYGFYDEKNKLPVWKTGSIASEFEIDFEGKPLFLVDISAFPGMSGSPAFAIVHGAYETLKGPTTVGRVQQFVGVYASNQVLEEKKYLEEIPSQSKTGIIIKESLQIGHIWKASLISNIIQEIDVKKYEDEILKKL